MLKIDFLEFIFADPDACGRNAVNRASKVGLSQVNTQGKVLQKVRMFNFIYQATTLDEEDIRKDNATEEEVK